VKEVVFVLLITLILSCSKDDELAIPSIVNTWNLDSQSLKNCKDSDSNIQESGMCTDATCYKYIFYADGLFTYEIKINGLIDAKKGFYTISGDQLTICISGCSIPVTFINSGDTLTLTYKDAVTGCDGTKIFKL
jgi:hypothetical protein